MASRFETGFGRGLRQILDHMGETATLYRADGSASQTITVTFNEQVGFVDQRRRAVFTFSADDLSGSDLGRGDYFVLDGETDRWYSIDIRDDKAGGIEVRCDGTIERM